MAANFPTVDKLRIPVGGARVFLGNIGATPTADVGTIEVGGGVKINTKRTLGYIYAGFPEHLVVAYCSKEEVEVEFEGMEYNPEVMRRSMGAGITSYSSTLETYSFGGDPGVTECAIHVRHEMLLGMTLNLYVWKALGASDSMSIQLSETPSKFPHKFMAVHCETDWNGTSLNGKAQLFKLERQIS